MSSEFFIPVTRHASRVTILIATILFLSLSVCGEENIKYSSVQIRVELADNLSDVFFSIEKGVIIDTFTEDIVFFIKSGENYSLKKNNRWCLSWKHGEEILKGRNLIVATDNPDKYIRFGNKKYRGKLVFLSDSYGKIRVINELPLEEYLCGVVPKELYSEKIEAMKAQAVIARTYAMANLGKHRDEGFDLCSGEHCQIYGGLEAEKPLSNKAVWETAGVILSYKGKLASHVVYHSTCGGHTENNENVFLTKPVEYLRGVPCYGELFPGKEKLFFCAMSPYFHWKVSWDKKELYKLVKDYMSSRYPSCDIGNIKEIFILERGISGRCRVLLIDGTKKDFKVDGDEIRRLLKYKNDNGKYVSLRSTNFFLTEKENSFEVAGRGWGHGCGLCQQGACGMAYLGAGYEDILHHYFKGIDIDTNYGQKNK